MVLISHRQRRWLLIFAVSLAPLVGLALWSNAQLVDFREHPLDFYTMKAGERFIVRGLTRRQEGSVKLGFAEGYDPPEIGVYGNHVFQYFSADAFGRSSGPGYFFNYWFANLALPEIYRYLRHIEHLGRLPKKLILVQITSPNVDNGQFIINYGYELPPDLLGSIEGGSGLGQWIEETGDIAWQLLLNRLHELFNYSNFVFGFVQNRHQDRVADLADCRRVDPNALLPPWARRLPTTVQDIYAFSTGSFRCQPQSFWGAFRPDGGNDAGLNDPPPVLDIDPLRDSDRGLRSGDEREIARDMRAIDVLGRRHGINVVFVVPPAYESNRDGSVVNQIFNRALALIPEVKVIDNRNMRGDPSLFMEYRHPSPKYFSLLVQELRRRGFVE